MQDDASRPVDGHAEEIDAGAEPGGGVALARVAEPVRHEVILALPPDQVRAAMVTHQELLQQILDPSDWQGRPNADGSFVKKSGWRKIALAYNLGLGRVSEEVDRDEEGTPLRASYTASATATNGRRVEATGHCAQSESRFARDGGRQKLENDMRATAETRAKNRAVSDLIGMGKVSAEEVQAGSSEAGGPTYGPAAKEGVATNALAAAAFLLDIGEGPDEAGGKAIIAKLIADTAPTEEGRYLPNVCARALLWAAAELKQAIAAQESATPSGVLGNSETEIQDADVVPDDDRSPEEEADDADIPFGG